MKYPDFVEQLIIEKEYTQLTPTEKQQVGEWVDNETEYTAIRQLLAGIDAVTVREQLPTPSASIKTNLQTAFNKKHGKPTQLKYSRNWVIGISVAASLLLLVGSVWVFNQEKNSVISEAEKPKVEAPNTVTQKQPEISVDTENKELPLATKENNPIQPDSSKEHAPVAVTSNNSITAATYPELNELMVTVF